MSVNHRRQTWSRRRVLTTALGGTAAAAAGAFGIAKAATAASSSASAAGDVVGKITVGYQGWFAAIGDGAPINGRSTAASSTSCTTPPAGPTCSRR